MHADLLKTQKNTLFKLIEQHQLLPSEFSWKMDGMGYSSDPCPVLIHRLSNHYFLFVTPRRGDDHWQFKCSPGMNQPSDADLYREGWPRIIHRFTRWCQDLKKELEADDLWATVRQSDLPNMEMANMGNASFTYNEVEMISQKVSHLITYIKEEASRNSNLQKKQDVIISSLVRLEQHAKAGVGRIDWTNQLVGIVFNVIIAASLSPERAGEFLLYIKGLFSAGINILISG